ncbi:dihydroxyacetone kinase phosphoryl donor subunit DhaM [Klenkia sp. PcliD-1-E]|uniref:dihydroxyacetone kinase phosphoryl donor subunit DhaM n=1 Tax=Klenkia sp. PcliD-1-E TaxID=2954492 RepID=UPI002097E154|nr:dihydroxyacetone kinase phosphoryl donor subunit DhaM [Klenkia sp. PcliD-1-E]MCO7219630.1 dihydroxyacetone kinase phosphoryl donor subunit DhaM [Klenkia sp. PcliD-1-E]
MTVGIVVVSHSRALADAAVELARQMLPGRELAVEVAAGTEDGGLGTDAMAVSAAVEAADSGEGTVVLMDLGSAVLSAETALEFLPDDVRERTTLSAAPLVEGLVGAVVVAAGGASREQVAAEAARGLAPKEAQLG